MALSHDALIALAVEHRRYVHEAFAAREDDV
jgi:hypothetical protein